MPVGHARHGQGHDHPAARRSWARSVLLANTYHLFLRPGSDIVRDAGGLHTFMNWDRAILTDSGGFQIFSLADTLKVSDDGVEFRSILDGTKHYWTPEDNIAPPKRPRRRHRHAARRVPAVSRREAARGHCGAPQRRVGRSLQGRSRARATRRSSASCRAACYADLRLESAERLAALDLPGYGIGGYSVGGAARPDAGVVGCLAVPRLPAAQAALPHGGGQSHLDPLGDSARRRHVRLRAADSHCSHGDRVLLGGAHEHAQRAVCARLRSARPRVLVHDVYARIPAPTCGIL